MSSHSSACHGSNTTGCPAHRPFVWRQNAAANASKCGPPVGYSARRTATRALADRLRELARHRLPLDLAEPERDAVGGGQPEAGRPRAELAGRLVANGDRRV